MKTTYASQDYLKAITTISLNTQKSIVKQSDIAKRLNISSAAVNDMVKKLAKENLVICHAYKGVELTKAGFIQGKKLIRNHRLWEVFLHQVLNMAWDTIHDEAEQLEHAASETLMDKIDAYLNHPKVDPHGNPIPDKQGRITTIKHEKKLLNCKLHTSLTIIRFTNFDSTYLDFLSKQGLAIGKKISILEHLDFDDSILCEIDNKTIQLSKKSGSNIYVED